MAVLFHAFAGDSTTILLFGDSIIAGYGLEEDQAIPSRLDTILGDAVHVINGGVSGDTTAAGRSRLAWMIEKHKPDMVLLALGGNDVLRGIPPSHTKENLDAMLAELAKTDTTTILSTIQPPDNLGEIYCAEFTAIYVDLAEKYGVPVYPFLLERTYGKHTLMQRDGIHPNEQGAELIAQDLAIYLQPLLEQPSG